MNDFYDPSSMPDFDMDSSQRDTGLRLARITRVDYEKMTMDIRWIDGGGGKTRVPISQPGRSYRASIVMMPEVDSIVVMGFIPYANQNKYPVPLAYLQNVMECGKLHDPIVTQRVPDRRITRARYKKAYPGEIYLGSTQGSDVFLDENICLQNARHNELTLRSSDQTLVTNTLAEYSRSAGVEFKSGIATRNRVQFNDDGSVDETAENELPLFSITSDGRVYRPISVKGTVAPDDTGNEKSDPARNSVYTEWKVRIRDTDPGVLAVNNELNGIGVDEVDENEDGSFNEVGVLRDVNTEMVLGNLIGDDFTEDDRELYGKHLQFSVFSGDNDEEGAPKKSVIKETNDPNQVTPQETGMGFYLNCRRTGSFETVWAVDKTGKSVFNFSGPGRCLDMRMESGTKWVMGTNGATGRSFDVTAKGGWRLDLRAEGEARGVAWDLQTVGGVREAIGTDQDGFSKVSTFAGNVQEFYQGDRYIEVAGNNVVVVTGTNEEQFLGKKTENYILDKTTNYGGDYSEIVVGSRITELGFGRRETISTPPLTNPLFADDLLILVGGKSVSLLFGNSLVTCLAGNINDTIVVGSRFITIGAGSFDTVIGAGQVSTTIGAGNYSVVTGAGNVSLQTAAGAFNLSTLVGAGTVSAVLGQLELTGGLGVLMQSNVQVAIVAPLVNIGTAPLGGAVVGIPSGVIHQDYIVGIPLLGVSTVLLGP